MYQFHLAAVLLLATFATTATAEKDWRLQPLHYNNPGLKVDLGVGLWAWPLPMDYDGDGDWDLLVSCPDKPSNGVYFFENATQDPNNKLPVFKPGVRLGRTGHNMQVSFVRGQPHLIREGISITRSSPAKPFDFDTSKRIYPKSNVHDKRVRGNMWRQVDYDGDGDHDLVVGVGDWTDYGWDHAYDAQGTWQNGPLHGHIYLIVNNGTDDAPKYSDQQQRLQAAGQAIDVYGWPSPNFADFDGDGDLDLLCGEFLDGFTYFENLGTRTKPAYSSGKRLRDDEGYPLAMHVQMITPTAVDWDGDGDQDLIVGDEDGRVALVENTGELKNNAPVFRSPQYFQQEADTIKFGALATPFVYDWDGDGDQDILCGNTAGNIGLFENLGQTENRLPRWSAPRLLESRDLDGKKKPFRIMAGQSGSIQGPCEAKWGYTTFSIADLDSDGDGDIIYNSILAKIGLLRNDDGLLIPTPLKTLVESPPHWYGKNNPSRGRLTQWRTTPVAIDFDADGKLDLVMLDQAGFLTLRSDFQQAQRIFVNEQNEPLQLNARTCGSSGRYKLSVVDWDQDGKLDLLVNSENATWYRNCGRREGKVVLKKIGNLAKRNVAGHTSSPAVCDFNHDGKPDLLVGAENGRLYYIAHDDCLSYSPQELEPKKTSSPPPPRIPGLVHEEFVFDKPPTKECHASTLCQTSRGLVASWFAGTEEKDKDVGIWTSYHDGARWSTPQQVATGVQHEDLRYPCWNPVLYQAPGDGPVLLFFKVGPDPKSWWGEMMISYDRGRTFRERRRLPEGIDGPVRCKPILLSNGRLLCGSSTEYDGWRVHFESVLLRDGLPSAHWKRSGPINDATRFNAIQPTILQHADGKLQALCRSKESVIVSTTSDDGGKTWTPLTKTDLPNPNSGIDAVTLNDGRFLLIYNHLDSGLSGWGRRGMLNLAISSDGLKWERVGTLEQERGQRFSYPAIIQSNDGMVHATYTWQRTHIKHVILDPNELKPEAN